MGKFKTLETIPEELENNSVLIYSNGTLKAVRIPDFGELLLKSSEGKIAIACVTEKDKF